MSARRHHRRSVNVTVATCALAMVSLLSVVSCGGDGERVELAVPLVFDLHVDPAADVEDIDPDRVDVLGAEQLRGVLDQDLAWHGISLVEVIRAARRNDPDVQVWIDQLVANTAAITAHVGLVYGPVGARAFNQQWGQHTQFLVDYAAAIGADDHAAATAARERLDDYARDAASFFDTATQGTLPSTIVEQLLSTHVQHMIDMIDADAANDIDSALDLAVTDTTYLSTISAALAAGIAKQQPVAFPGSTLSTHAEYCSIVTEQTSGYLVSLLITDDPDSPVVHDAATQLAHVAGTGTAEVVGFDGHLQPSPTEAAAAKAALDHAAAFASGNSNPTTAPPPG